MSERKENKFPVRKWAPVEIQELIVVTKDAPARGVRKIIEEFAKKNNRSADAAIQKYHELKKLKDPNAAPVKKMSDEKVNVKIEATLLDFQTQLFILLSSKAVKNYSITKAKITIILKS